jgi:hypothetical protein
MLRNGFTNMKKTINHNIESIEKQKKDGSYKKGQYMPIIPEDGLF